MGGPFIKFDVNSEWGGQLQRALLGGEGGNRPPKRLLAHIRM